LRLIWGSGWENEENNVRNTERLNIKERPHRQAWTLTGRVLRVGRTNT